MQVRKRLVFVVNSQSIVSQNVVLIKSKKEIVANEAEACFLLQARVNDVQSHILFLKNSLQQERDFT